MFNIKEINLLSVGFHHQTVVKDSMNKTKHWFATKMALNLRVDDSQCIQVTLLVRLGVVGGIHKASQIAILAFVSSTAAFIELGPEMLPEDLRSPTGEHDPNLIFAANRCDNSLLSPSKSKATGKKKYSQRKRRP